MEQVSERMQDKPWWRAGRHGGRKPQCQQAGLGLPAEGLCGPRLAHRLQSPEGTRPARGSRAVVPKAASPTEGKLSGSK